MKWSLTEYPVKVMRSPVIDRLIVRMPCHKWKKLSHASLNIFGKPSEYVPSGVKLPEASANLCQMVHISIALCKYVFGFPQSMMNTGSQPNSIANFGFPY